IHWVDYTELKTLEEERQYQVMPIAGTPVTAAAATKSRRQKLKKQLQNGGSK
ncbi:MAG: ferredoxin, partial [Symploca sp. SIO2D2]|nr:ferredoxin [Symploca sp. SIO2D2]